MKVKQTFLTHLDPRSKLFALLLISIIALMSPTTEILGIIAIFLVAVCFLGNCMKGLYQMRFMILSTLLFSLLTWSLLFGGEPRILSLFSISGIFYGFNLFLKLFVMIVGGTILMGSTKTEELCMSMIKMGVSYKIAFAFSSALRIVPMILKEYQMILEAQQVRGLDLKQGNGFKRLQKHVPVIIPAILLMIRNASEFADALETKGFGVYEKRSSYHEIKFKSCDYIVCSIILIIFTGMAMFRVFVA